MKAILVDDGYNGHQLECNAVPIEEREDSVKLASSKGGLIKWIDRAKWESLVNDETSHKLQEPAQ